MSYPSGADDFDEFYSNSPKQIFMESSMLFLRSKSVLSKQNASLKSGARERNGQRLFCDRSKSVCPSVKQCIFPSF